MEPVQTLVRASARLYQRLSAYMILVGAFVCLVYFLLYFTLNSSFAFSIFDGLVNDIFQGKVTWHRISWGPAPWRIKILEPRIQGTDGEAVITARTVTVNDIRLIELLKGNVAADNITIETPIVRIKRLEVPVQKGDYRTSEFVMNIAEVFKPKATTISDGRPSSPMLLAFNSVDVKNAVFVLDFKDQAVVAHGINITDGRFDLKVLPSGDQMTIGARQVEFKQGEVRINTRPTEVRALTNGTDGCLRFPISETNIREFNWIDDEFKVARVLAKVRGDTLSVERFRIDLNTPSVEMGGLIRLSIDAIEKHLGPFGLDTVQGPVSIQIEGYGEPEAFEGEVQVVSPKLTVGPVEIGALDISAEQKADGSISVNDLNAHFEGGRISGSGIYDIETEKGYVNLWVDDLDWTKFPIELPAHVKHAVGGRVRGFVHGRIQNAMTDAPAANAAINLAIDRNFPNRFGLGLEASVNASVELSDDELTIHTLFLQGEGDRVEVGGFYDLFTTEADISGFLRVNRLSPVTQEFGPSIVGSLNAQWRIDGRIRNPRIFARINGRRLGYSNLPKFDATGAITLLNGILELDKLSLDSESGQIGAQGTIDLFSENLPIDMRLDARQFDLKILPVDLAGLTGHLAMDIEAKGSIHTPRVKGRLRLGKPCWQPPGKKEPLCFRRLDTVGEWSKDQFRLEKFVLRDREHILVQINGKGRIKSKVFDGNIMIDDAAISLVNQIIPEPLPIGGRISLDLKTSGTLLAPRARGLIKISDARYGQYDLGNAKLSIKGDTRETRLRGHILNGIGLVAVIPTDGENHIAEASLQFAGFKPEKWIPEMASLPLRSALTGQAVARFDLNETTLLDILLNLSGLNVAYRLDENVEYQASAREAFTVKFDGRRATIDNLDLGLTLVGGPSVTNKDSSTLRIAGDMTTDGALNFALNGGINFALLHPFITDIFSEYTGRIALSGRVTGYGSDIRPYALVTLESADLVPRSAVLGGQLNLQSPVTLEIAPSIGPPPLANDGLTPLTGIMELRLKPTPEKLAKNIIRLLRDESPLHIEEVHVHFEEFTPRTIKIAASATDLVLAIPRTVRATINSPRLVFDMWEQEIDDQPPERRMRLSGDIQVLRGEYTKDVTGLQEINQDLRNSLTSRAETGEVSLFERVPALKRLMLDLSVTGDGAFFVRNQIAVLNTNLELRIDLKEVKGFIYPLPEDKEDERLRIQGDISLLPESKLTYARREFEVANGRIDFGGLNFVEANVTATRTFSLQRGGASAGLSSSFDTGGAGVRLEEVVLSAKLALPTIEAQPQFDFQLSSKGGASPFEVAMLVLTGSYPEDLSGAASAQPATEVLLAPLLSLVERPLEDTLKVDLALTPDSQGSLVIDANKILSRRLRLYSRVLVGDDSDSRQQQIGLEYQINNVTFGELSSERTSSLVTTTGRLRLKLNLN